MRFERGTCLADMANVPEGAEEGLDEKTVDGKGWSG